MSDGGRGRASLEVEMWKSSQSVDSERSGVRSIAWLGLWGLLKHKSLKGAVPRIVSVSEKLQTLRTLGATVENSPHPVWNARHAYQRLEPRERVVFSIGRIANKVGVAADAREFSAEHVKGGEWTFEPGLVLRDPFHDGALQLIWLGLSGVHVLWA